MQETIIVYTDGACSGNPGNGGYGIVMKLKNKNYRKEFSQGYKLTTNNRMELLAVIVALSNIKKPNQKVLIHTDSKYVHDAIEKKWLNKWEKTNFKGKKNSDLWKKYLSVSKNQNVRLQWVKGHNGNIENEKADQLAVNSMKSTLLIDHGYKQ